MHPSGRTAPPAAGRVRDGSAQCSQREEIGELMMSRCFVTTLRRSNIYQRAFSFADSFFHPLLPRNPISSTVPLYNAPPPRVPLFRPLSTLRTLRRSARPSPPLRSSLA